MDAYLVSSEWIDHDHPSVAAKARELAAGARDARQVAERCFEFVRDRIRHSWDYRDDAVNPVTCKASAVLEHATGYCYAKSHLLAALLRANGIPAGLCYQRLSIGGDGAPFCLHGLNAVYLDGVGWYHVDARGNKPGVDTQFCPPQVSLAYPPKVALGERSFAAILAEPLQEVVDVLMRSATVWEVDAQLPDLMAIDEPA